MNGDIKIRLWYPAVKQMRHFSMGQVNFLNGKWGIFFPVEEGDVFIATGIPMLFTGKTDVGGHELYADDIVRSRLNGILMVIRYGEYRAYCPADQAWETAVGFFAEAEGYPQMPLGPTESYAELLGNIHENPDLMN